MAKPPGFRPSPVIRLARLFHRLEASVVHTHHVGPLLYGDSAACLSGVPCVIHTEHDAWHLENTRRRWIQAASLRLTRPSLVADSDLVAAAVTKCLPNSRVRTIPNGIDTRRFTPGNNEGARRALGLPAGVTLVGCAARLERVKGHDILIDAMARLPGNVHLALAGAGSREAALRALVHERGLVGRVHFLGPVEDMPTFYRALDIFCLASRHEGMPLAPLEAQACGVPCLLTDVGGGRDAIPRWLGGLRRSETHVRPGADRPTGPS